MFGDDAAEKEADEEDEESVAEGREKEAGEEGHRVAPFLAQKR